MSRLFYDQLSKDKAKEQFRMSFTDCSERDLFAEVVKELYSERAN